MASYLNSCPDDIILAIAVLLGLDDIRNLRLTCKSMAAKSLHHFKSFFYNKTLDLTTTDLGAFAQRTKSGGLRCLVRDLCLIGIAHEDGENGLEKTDTTSHTELLKQAFDSLARFGETGALSLSLRVVFVTSDGRRIEPVDVKIHGMKRVWLVAAATLITSFKALATSKLQIKSVNIFNGPGLHKCSLAGHQLNEVDWTSMEKPFAHLRSLSISISNAIPHFLTIEEILAESGEDDSGESSFDEDSSVENESNEDTEPSAERHSPQQADEVNNETNFVGMTKLLSLREELDSFELHYFCVALNREPSLNPHHERLLQTVTELEKLPRIKRCSLRGIFVRQSDLLAFIQKTDVQELSLVGINVESGTYKPIFQHCISRTTRITKISFDTLYENSKMIHFCDRERPFIEASPLDKSRALERQGDAVKMPLYYAFRGGRGLVGTPQYSDWLKYRRIEYGPF